MTSTKKLSKDMLPNRNKHPGFAANQGLATLYKPRGRKGQVLEKNRLASPARRRSPSPPCAPRGPSSASPPEAEAGEKKQSERIHGSDSSRGTFHFMETIKNHQKPLKTIKHHQTPSNTIENHQKPSKTIKNHQKPSKAIKNRQTPSNTIKHHLSRDPNLSRKPSKTQRKPSFQGPRMTCGAKSR